MLDECNTEAEVELILRQSSAQRPAHCRRLLEDCRDILEYSTLEPPLKNMVVNRHFAAYVEDLWRKHQVVGRAGLKESISTSRLRSNAEAFVAPMIDPNSLGDWLEFPIKWALCIVLLPLMMLYVELGAAVISVHARRDHHISVDHRDRRCCMGSKCARSISDLLRDVFVWLDAARQIPALVAGALSPPPSPHPPSFFLSLSTGCRDVGGRARDRYGANDSDCH